MAWQVYACIEMPHHMSEHERYMFRSFALCDHTLLGEWHLKGSGITLDKMRFLIELWNTSTEIRYRWLISDTITGMLNPLTCTEKDIRKLEWAQKSCTDYSKFQKLGIHETSAQPSFVLLVQSQPETTSQLIEYRNANEDCNSMTVDAGILSLLNYIYVYYPDHS